MNDQGLTGLANLGNTCFANQVTLLLLPIFKNIEFIREFNKTKNAKRKDTLNILLTMSCTDSGMSAKCIHIYI